LVRSETSERLGSVLTATSGELPNTVRMQSAIKGGQLERPHVGEPFEHLA